MSNLLLIPAALAAYLIGSFPTGVLMARLFGWPDPRAHDSGHTGGLNTLRGAGFWAGFLVGVIDLGKGALAVWVATRIAPTPWAIAVGGPAVVAGHSWSVWLNFKGGMGLSTAAGAVGGYSIFTVLGMIVVWLIARLVIIKHTPRSVILTMFFVPPMLLLFHAPLPVLVMGTGCAVVIVIRHLSDWNRVYEKAV